jgi:hypothetical protein
MGPAKVSPSMAFQQRIFRLGGDVGICVPMDAESTSVP